MIQVYMQKSKRKRVIYAYYFAKVMQINSSQAEDSGPAVGMRTTDLAAHI